MASSRAESEPILEGGVLELLILPGGGVRQLLGLGLARAPVCQRPRRLVHVAFDLNITS